MKLPAFSPIVPALSALALLAAPGTSRADHHKITVYQDRDHDGHFNKRTIDVSHRRYYSRGAYGYGYSPYYYGHPYGDYGYGYGPSVSFSFQHSPGYSSDSDDLAVDVQRELRRRGYYRGSIDGDIGPGTRAAIRTYQYDRGLAPTGRIDGGLLRSLGID